MQFKQARSWRQIGTAPGDGTSSQPTVTFYMATYDAGDGQYFSQEQAEPFGGDCLQDFALVFASIAAGEGYPPFTYTWTEDSVPAGGYVIQYTPAATGSVPVGTETVLNLDNEFVQVEVSTGRVLIDSSAIGLTSTVVLGLRITDANGEDYDFLPDITFTK